ncbi:MAG: hypothetical protein H0X24_19900, partial [Ktedonobacterales bacterium]|nr:hypothetical protein [Ktedonobacterales bacterium]
GQVFAVTGGSVHELVGLSGVVTRGSTQSATFTLTIAPLSAGTAILSDATPTFNFAPGTPAPADVQFVAPSGVTLLDNAVYAGLPNNQFDIMYDQLRALNYTNPEQTIALTTNSAIALQGNRP